MNDARCNVCHGSKATIYGDPCVYCDATGKITAAELRIVRHPYFQKEVSNPAIALGLARAAIEATREPRVAPTVTAIMDGPNGPELGQIVVAQPNFAALGIGDPEEYN